MTLTPPPAPDARDAPVAPIDEHLFPCDQCGADYRFSPSEGKLHCDHCGHEKSVAQQGPWDTQITEMDFAKGVALSLADADIEETRVSSCPNCAAQVTLDPDIHATECPFCATPVVTDTSTHRHIKPKGVVPFYVDETTAKQAMTTWMGKLWFAPNGLQDYARKGRKLQGVYVPYWTFDADTSSTYRGERGKIYYETRQVMRDGKMTTQRVQKIRWFPASGRVARFFDDVLVLASQALPRKFIQGLAPWDLSRLTPYTPEFLAGFQAEGYSIELQQGFETARDIMDQQIARDIRFDIGGDRQRIHHVDTRLSDITYKHILLPVWIAAYKYRGTSYRFVVNGQTGRVQGERPYSAWKITFAVITGLLIAGAIGYAIALNQGTI